VTIEAQNKEKINNPMKKDTLAMLISKEITL
jgi:hypothetical protein